MEKKDLIVSSTKKLILKKGYNNTSVEDITKNLGISKGSFYTYFKSKHCVIDYILTEQLVISKNIEKNFFEKDMTLESCIEKLVKTRIIFKEDNSIKINLLIANLFRNLDSLSQETLCILKKLEEINLKVIANIIYKYVKKIKEKEIEKYSRILNNIINNYKIFELFISQETMNFITTTTELKNKYRDLSFQLDINILIKSILKILTY